MDSENDPLIGTIVSGRYRVLKALGEGGMGRVYLAEHEAIQKKVALKVLHIEYSRKADIVTRFQQEAISASRIKHPNVLDVFDFGQLEDGSFFLAMEFLEGNDLADELQRARVVDAQRGLQLAVQICRALAVAHGKGVVHRDMKPENVFLQRTEDGQEIVKIVDFGIAQLRSNEEAEASQPQRRRLTKTGMIFGTPEYMAPEQASGRHADHRADVYAVGVILYEMFTGAVPFTGETFLGVLTKTLQEPPPPMSQIVPDLALSAEFQAAVMRALEKSPEDRYSGMHEFAQALLDTPEGAHFRSASFSHVPSLGVSRAAAGPLTAQQFASAQPHAPERPETTSQGTMVTSVPATTASSAARTASTQVVTASTAPPRGSGPGVVAGSFAAVAVVGALGAGWWFIAGRQSSALEPEPAASVEAPAASGSMAPAPAPSAAPPASASVGPATGVSIRVETAPPGAVVMKDGFQVCDESPCVVAAAPNETLELTATKGRLKGSSKVLAQRDQTVQIALAGPPAPRPRPPSGASDGRQLCEYEEDGLKVLRPCR